MSEQTDNHERDYVRNLFYMMLGVFTFLFFVPTFSFGIVSVVSGTAVSFLLILMGGLTKFYK